MRDEYVDSFAQPLTAEDLLQMVRVCKEKTDSGRGLAGILTTVALWDKVESLIHPNFRTYPLTIAGVPVFGSRLMSAGEVWLIDGSGERIGRLCSKTA